MKSTICCWATSIVTRISFDQMNRAGRKRWHTTLPISASNMWVPSFSIFSTLFVVFFFLYNLDAWPWSRNMCSGRCSNAGRVSGGGFGGSAGLILAMNNGERAPDPPRWDYLAEEHRRTASRGGAGAQREQCVDDGHGRREFPWEGPRRATMYLKV
jgi:hypothetical protein